MVRLLESNREQNLKSNFYLLTVLYIMCGGKYAAVGPGLVKKINYLLYS